MNKKIVIVSAHEALAVHNMIKDIPIIQKFLSKPVHKKEFQKTILENTQPQASQDSNLNSYNIY